LVPVSSGAAPRALGGWQSSQAGTLFEVAGAVATDDDPAAPAGAETAGPDVLARGPVPEKPEENVGVVALPGPAREVDGAPMIPGKVTAPYRFVIPVPDIVGVAVPATPAVWAAAEPASTAVTKNVR
jgi:hypothetical protein